MSTSTKSPNTIRQGGPGASHENAKEPKHVEKPPADSDNRKHSNVSTGGGEKDTRHAHNSEHNAGTHKAKGDGDK